MSILAAILATLLAAALVFVQPLAGRRRYKRLETALAKDPGARLHHYGRGIAGEWVAAGAAVVIGLLARRHPSSVGLTIGRHAHAATIIVIEVAVILGASALLFRLGGSAARAVLLRQTRGFAALLPRTQEEKAAFALLAVTAGVCEELLFRGFGIAYIRWLWPSASHAWLIALTAVVFGLVHLYQGPRNVAFTGLAGAWFAWVVLSTGSLLPAMIIHALVDLRVLALPPLHAGDDATAPRQLLA